MNTVIGFACSVGLKMGYNNHHHEEQANAASSHHQHQEQSKEHDHSQQPSNSKDDCCSNDITSFNLLDKSVTNTVNIDHPVFTSVFVASFNTDWTLSKFFIPKNIRAFARPYHPPFPDIRVAIQSFQI